MNRLWKGSYTVEAAAVFSICFLLIGSTILLGYEIYHEALMDTTYEIKSIDTIHIFRAAEMGEELFTK